MSDEIQIQLICAYPYQQTIVDMTILKGSTVMDAVNKSEILSVYPSLQDISYQVGIFGKKVNADYILQNNDQVEIYRPVTVNPREQRILNSKK